LTDMIAKAGRRHLLLVIAVLAAMSHVLHAQNKVSAWEAEADALMENEDYEAAIKLYDRIVSSIKAEDQELVEVLYKRAVCLYSLDRLDGALADVDKAIGLSPSFTQARLLRAFIYRDLDNMQGQMNDLGELLKASPLNVELIKWQSYLLIQDKSYDSARQLLKYARMLKNDAEIELYLGMTYYYAEDADSALLHFDKALAFRPDNLHALLYAGSLCLDESAYALALTYLNKAQELHPENLSVLFYKGVALTEMGQQEEGCRYLSRAFYGGEDDAGSYLEFNCFRYDPD